MPPGSDRCVAGVDVGSTLTKVVVRNGSVLASATDRTQVDYVGAAARLLAGTLGRTGRAPADLAYVVATGYGRRRLPFADREITEITCHARGVREIFPEARTVIDIGGQDAKGIKLAPGGKVVNFAMNDKCAAGTGRFLEVMAASLGLTLDELGARSLGAAAPASISSVCTVFAEQELTQRLAEGVPLEDVLAGLHAALASRIHRMVRGLHVEQQVILTGGCALNLGLVRALEERLGLSVLTPPDPLLTGALGAALLAAEALERGEMPQTGPRLAELSAAAAAEASQDGREDDGRRRVFSVRSKPKPYRAWGAFSLPASERAAGLPRGGVDAGALFTKAVVVHGERAAFTILRSEGDYRRVAEDALAGALGVLGTPREALAAVAGTGLGAAKISLGSELSEITCLATGIARLFPDAAQVIDVGGHGTRVIRLGPGGAVKDFAVTGQCAAGSARILEVIAHLLGLDLAELGEVSLRSKSPAEFVVGCAVFAETEAISFLTRGISREDLLAGLHQSLAARILAMARAGGAPGPWAVTGGGAKDAGLVARLRAAPQAIVVPPEPMVVAALGAALLAGDRRAG
jgi:predicted CoA-substrate-specific enzyme activase